MRDGLAGRRWWWWWWVGWGGGGGMSRIWLCRARGGHKGEALNAMFVCLACLADPQIDAFYDSFKLF